MGILPMPSAVRTRGKETTPFAHRRRPGSSRESGWTVKGLRRPITAHGQDAHATWPRRPAPVKIPEIRLPDAEESLTSESIAFPRFPPYL
jgi:hypothetical protein